MLIDPKSKLIATWLLVMGTAISVDFFQVLFFAILLIPMTILYRPNKSIFKRIITFIPFLFIISLIMYFSFSHNITIHIFKFQKTYTPREFILFNSLRFFVSVTHSSLLLESEGSTTEIIEALASIKVLKNIVAILHLINRLISRLQQDYNKMLVSAEGRGYLQSSKIKRLMLRLRILSRLLTKAVNYSDTIGYTLTARGFSQEEMVSSIRNWSSEGISMVIIVSLCTFLFVSLPLWAI